MKLISYYDLLGMIKEGNIPDKVYWINHEKKKIAYKSTYDSVNNSFNCYILQHRNQETEDIKFYLSECLLESSFFDKCIEIPNDDFEDIEELKINMMSRECYIDQFENKINELIKAVNKLKNKE